MPETRPDRLLVAPSHPGDIEWVKTNDALTYATFLAYATRAWQGSAYPEIFLERALALERNYGWSVRWNSAQAEI